MFVLRFVRQFVWILLFTLLGEGLHAVLPLPIPAAIYGLALLFAALQFKLLPVSEVHDAGSFLLAIMPVLFVAPAVNLVSCWDLINPVWLPLLILIVLSTLVTFALSGKVTQMLMPKEEKEETDHD